MLLRSQSVSVGEEGGGRGQGRRGEGRVGEEGGGRGQGRRGEGGKGAG